jgi:hypothetical protein
MANTKPRTKPKTKKGSAAVTGTVDTDAGTATILGIDGVIPCDLDESPDSADDADDLDGLF